MVEKASQVGTSYRELEEREQLLGSIFESIEHGVLVFTSEGKISHFNGKLFEIWGIPTASLEPGMRLGEFLELLPALGSPPVRLAKSMRPIAEDMGGQEDLVTLNDGRVISRTVYPLAVGAGGEKAR